jgi:serine protease Do
MALAVQATACTAAPPAAPSGATAIINTSTVTLAASPPPPAGTAIPVNFVDAVARVLPSVVLIEVQYGPGGAPGQPTATAGAGTGWIIAANGLIVTNDHVVANAATVTVTLASGTKYTPTSVQHAPQKDLAVLKINAQNLPAVAIGKSADLKLGQPVAAVGNALDLGARVTTGVVSQLNATVAYQGNLTLSGLIGTDATINPGNSGGVLIDINGAVVGITNGGIQDPTLDVENLGYAIAIDDAMPVINNLVAQIHQV